MRPERKSASADVNEHFSGRCRQPCLGDGTGAGILFEQRFCLGRIQLPSANCPAAQNARKNQSAILAGRRKETRRHSRISGTVGKRRYAH